MDNGLMIEAKNLAKTFGAFTAVDGIDLVVRKGTIHGFVGPNGAGKTTTMKMLIGAISCTAPKNIAGASPAIITTASLLRLISSLMVFSINAYWSYYFHQRRGIY